MDATSSGSTPQGSTSATKPARLVSLDAFRGFIMVVLLLDGYLPAIATRFPDNPLMQELGRQFSHVDWQGWTFWDLIMPSFLFMVGVAMTYSYFARRARGDSTIQVAGHVVYRSVVFIALGLILASLHFDRIQWKFGELLCQIGLAYPFAYLLLGRSSRTKWIAAGAILLVTWLAFLLYPLPGPGFDYASFGAQGPGPFTGLFAHWNKYTNLADAFDHRFLPLLPQADVVVGGERNVPLLNFVPSIVTLLFGMIAGDLLRSGRTSGQKLRSLLAAGVASLGLGLLVGHTLCPIVKPLWTPAFVLVSTGFVCWFLAAAFWLADIMGWGKELLPLTIVGRNPLVVYLMFRALREPIQQGVETFVGTFFAIGHSWSFQVLGTVAVIWLAAVWLYRRKIFITV